MNDNKGRKMIEKYNLNGEKLPTLPTPHDCEIVEVECNDEFLVFKFANNLSCYDSIKAYRPEASSLVIKYHLIDSEVITYIKRKDWTGYDLVDTKTIIKKHKKLEYLYQYISHYSLIIKLFEVNEIMLEIQCDYLEYEWL